MIVPFKTAKAEGAFVKVPEGSYGFWLATKDDVVFKRLYYRDEQFIELEPRLPIDYFILGLTFDITEEQARGIVDGNNGDHPATMWMDYTTHETDFARFHCVNALLSFHSLMESLEVYEANPYGISPKLGWWPNDGRYGTFGQYKDRWHAAQDRTGTWLVLVKKGDTV